jgi:hypothetical protein
MAMDLCTSNDRRQTGGAEHNATPRDNCSAVLLASPIETWTYAAILAEAGRYPDRDRFFKGSFDAYAAARRAGKLEAACAHMEKPRIG